MWLRFPSSVAAILTPPARYKMYTLPVNLSVTSSLLMLSLCLGNAVANAVVGTIGVTGSVPVSACSTYQNGGNNMRCSSPSGLWCTLSSLCSLCASHLLLCVPAVLSSVFLLLTCPIITAVQKCSSKLVEHVNFCTFSHVL